MKKKRMAGSIAVLLVLVALVMFRQRVPTSLERVETKSTAEPITTKSLPANPTSTDVGQLVGNHLPDRAQPSVETKHAFGAIFNASLSLYGKVVDQDGEPVAGARVKIGVADKPWDSGSSYQRTSGADGLFEITDVKGGGIYAEVEKEGYYSGKESRRLFQSGEMPTKDAPAIWKLYRIGLPEPLNVQPYRVTEMPLDGTPVEYDFSTGNFVGSGQGHLRVEVKVEGSMQQRFTWWYRLSLPSGGLASRTHEFDFIAPEQGYAEVLEGRLDADDINWRASFGGDFFVRLPNGKFGRFVCSLGKGRDSFSFRVGYAAINPTGSRNLELDPKMVHSFEP